MRLRHRVELQSNAPTQDATGQPVESWSTYRTCWGAVIDQGGQQSRRGELERGTVDTEVVIRYPREDGRLPLPTDRVRYTEQAGRVRVLNVDSVQRNDSKRRMLTMACTEVQDG